MGICSKTGTPPPEVPPFTEGAYPCFRCYVWHLETGDPPSPEDLRMHLAKRCAKCNRFVNDDRCNCGKAQNNAKRLPSNIKEGA